MGSLLCCKSFSTSTCTQDPPLLKNQQVTMVAHLEKVCPIKWGHLSYMQMDATTPNNVRTCSAKWEGYNP